MASVLPLPRGQGDGLSGDLTNCPVKLVEADLLIAVYIELAETQLLLGGCERAVYLAHQLGEFLER